MLPARPLAPAMDVVARNGDVLVKLDLPGSDPAKDMTVTVGASALTIHGERHETTGAKALKIPVETAVPTKH